MSHHSQNWVIRKCICIVSLWQLSMKLHVHMQAFMWVYLYICMTIYDQFRLYVLCILRLDSTLLSVSKCGYSSIQPEVQKCTFINIEYRIYTGNYIHYTHKKYICILCTSCERLEREDWSQIHLPHWHICLYLTIRSSFKCWQGFFWSVRSLEWRPVQLRDTWKDEGRGREWQTALQACFTFRCWAWRPYDF